MIQVMDAILSLVPNAKCVVSGDQIVLWESQEAQPTDAEIDTEVARLQALEPSNQRIAELKQLLADSDYKVLPDYDKPDDGIVDQRQAWRDEIRALESAQ
jgi:hypothetical protein